MFKVVVYKNGFDPYQNKVIQKQKREEEKEQKKEDNIHRSVRRSRSIINDYVLCNDFNLFATFTFNPLKVDRYDIAVVYMKMQGWLNRQRRIYPGFGYIVVPERHKDGAIHFHATLKGFGGDLKRTNVVQDGKRVYNLPSFRFGFTNVTELDDDRYKTIAYMCKYITKDMEMVRGNRRYWASKNLNKPIVSHNTIWDTPLHTLLGHKTLRYETEFSVVYEVPRASVVAAGHHS